MNDDRLAPAALPSTGETLPTDRRALLDILEDLEVAEREQSAEVEALTHALQKARAKRDDAYNDRQLVRKDIRVVRMMLRNTMPIDQASLGLDEGREDA